MNFIKRIFLISALVAVLCILGAAPVFAQLLDKTQVNQRLDQILPPDVVNKRADGLEGPPASALPTANFKEDIIPQAIKILLQLVGTVSFGVFVYAGVMLVIAQGNEEDIKKFKNILIWSIVGLAFITTSYAIVSGVMNISFTD